jgi:uncharacterized protein (UPF0332 family)/predicted nucleotidyltransferase
MIEKDFAERQTMRDHPRLRHLTPHERDVLAEFLSRLREQYGDRIAHVWLFGSKVRGDSDEESDVDLLIVARDGDDALQKVIGEIAYELSLEHGVLLCEHVISTWRFAQMRARQEPIYKNIVREGVDLWASETAPTKVAEEQAPYDLGTPEDYLRHRLERSHEDLTWARGALERGEYRLALNRAYYAVFHLTSAVLANLDVLRHRHSAVESAFHEYLIKPGFIEPEYGQFYREARQWREDADYHFDVEFTKDKTREVLEQAERIVTRLERFLCQRGLLTENGKR